MDLTNFDWGWMDKPSNIMVTNGDITKDLSQWHKDSMILEIFENKMYEKFFEVEKNDIVVDVGASVGPFTYSILHKKPKHVYCIEPSPAEIDTLIKNIKDSPVTYINKGIDSFDGVGSFDLFGVEGNKSNVAQSMTFNTFLKEYHIEKIDFIKTDCEGGEYSIFNNENIFWIKQNVRKMVGEWHLDNQIRKNNFKIFRDTYLRLFPNVQVYSVDGVDIKWSLWNDDFINYYMQIMVYIDNR
jgi:hypothetical protein